MQRPAVPRRYPTSFNHTPRCWERADPETSSPLRSRGRSTSVAASTDGGRKHLDLRAQGEAGKQQQAIISMAVATLPLPPATDGRQGGHNVLRKARSPAALYRASPISRRHSWTSSHCPPTQQQRDLSRSPAIMEVTEADVDLSITEEPAQQASSKRAFSMIKTGATFELAYFLRNTGPPPLVRKTSATKEESHTQATPKRGRNIFRKRRELLDSEMPAAEDAKSDVFIPIGGVEQKTTARGMLLGDRLVSINEEGSR